MKNYMNRWVLLALKAIVILVWLACLWGQLFAVPGLSGALAGLYPSQTSMRWPYLIMGVLFLFCIEAAFVAVWKLFSLSGSGGRAKAVRFTTLDAICKALDCQPGDILEWEDDD